MEGIFLYIQENLSFLIQYKFVFFFLGAVFEGLSTMVLAGFLASSVGGINIFGLFAVLSTGYILNGLMWYLVGYLGGSTALDKWGHKHHVSHDVINKVTMYFDRHSGKAIILSKFTLGFTIAIMIMAGSLKYNLKRFFLYNSIGSIGWASLTMGVGYFFGESFKIFMNYLRSFSLFLVALGSAIGLIYALKIILKKYFNFTIKFDDKLEKIRVWLKDKAEFNVDNHDSENEEKEV